MEIKQIIAQGEMLDAEQLAKVVGGLGIEPSNSNNAQNCHCEGMGSNTNHVSGYYCNSNLHNNNNDGCLSQEPAG